MKQHWLFNLLVAMLLVLSAISCFAKDVINYPWIGNDTYGYDKFYQGLLKLALDKSTVQFGDYELNQISIPINQSRAIDLIYQEKFINVFWTMTSRDREKKLLPIRIPLLKGLAGCRVFLINKQQKSVFDQLTTEQFMLKQPGQGEDWPDRTILEHNGFNVLTGNSHDGLFMMLKRGRFDYFPRAIYEAYNEMAVFPEFTISEKRMFYYDSPMFFFVSLNNPHLHERLSYGLEQAVLDGSFNEYFEHHEVTKELAKVLTTNKHTVYTLENPLLTEETKQTLASLNNQFICGANATYVSYPFK